jgi:hypothetical protein
VAEAAVTAVADGEADVEAEAFGVAVGEAPALAVADPEADGEAVVTGAQIPLGIADGASSV